MQSNFQLTACPNCGANVSSQQASCPACGAPLQVETQSTEARQRDVQELVESSNQRLASSGTSAAESAFGIGCSLGGIASMVLLLIVFAIGGRDWTLLAIVALVAILLATGISAWLANKAKSATIQTTFDREVGPQIERYIKANQLTSQEFGVQAAPFVAEDAPLRNYLTLPTKEVGMAGPEES